MPRERRGGSTPLSPTSDRCGRPARRRVGPLSRVRPSALYFAGDADHQDPGSQVHHRPRDRAPARAPRPRRRRGRPPPLAADARPRLPARQGAARRPRAARSARAPSSTRPSTTSSRTPTATPSSSRTSCRSPTPTWRSSRPRRASRSSSRRPSRSARRSSSATTSNFNFRPEIETIDDAKVDKVIEELRDQNATLAPVEDRGAKNGDYAVIGFDGHPRRRAVRGRLGRADAADPRRGAPDPGLRGEPRRPRGRRHDRLRHHLPGRLPARPTLAGQDGPLRGRARGAPREGPARARRRLRRGRSATSPTSPRCGRTIKARLERNALDRARHEFADKIIEYAVANATLDLPDILVDQEVEVMHDEFRGSLARQGIDEEAYLKVTEQDRGRPPRRLPARRREAGQGPARPLEGRRGRGRRRSPTPTSRPRSPAAASATPDDREAARPTSSRSAAARFIRSTLRRSRVVERPRRRVARRHPEHPAAAAPRGRAGGGRRRATRPPPTPRSTRPIRGSILDDDPTTRPADRPPDPASATPPLNQGVPRCSCRWSSSPPAGGSAPTTSTRGC